MVNYGCKITYSKYRNFHAIQIFDIFLHTHTQKKKKNHENLAAARVTSFVDLDCLFFVPQYRQEFFNQFSGEFFIFHVAIHHTLGFWWF